jgi:signal transduction histidine kinase/CheY-like chemotaxis protein/HPt (histidine-containing phosphotransfer) domain-containing protein
MTLRVGIGALLSRWREAPAVAILSTAVVAGVACAAVFVLPGAQSFWLTPLLLLAAAGSTYAMRGASAAPPPDATQHAGASAAPETDHDARMRELTAELDKLRHMQAELLQAKHTAEAAMMSKSEFLATMSHEIRTPLNGIIPLLDILLTSPLAPDQQDYLQTAYKSANELLKIVDDILDYSKIEASKLVLESVVLNLREIADAVKRLFEKNAEAKQLRFSVNIDPAVRLAVRGDPVRLRQILTNLVSNAIKFTPRGAVAVQISKRSETRTHSEVLFVVKDTGVGVAPEAAAKLFQPFSQADATTTRIHGGTGLGLVICKRLVELMGGKIGVRSELGKGSVFWFSVPFLKAPGDVEHARRSLRGVRALVLSSDAAVAKRLGAYFAAWSMAHLQTPTVADALSKLRSSSGMGESWAYDVLAVDVNAVAGHPGTLLRNIASDPALEQLRVLVVLADRPAPADLADDKRVGFVQRRYSERDLEQSLRRLLEIAEPGMEHAATFTAPAAAAEAPQVQIVAPEAEDTQPLAGHVLLVEDNPVNRQVAQRLLALAGITYRVAENGREAIEALDDGQRRFDAVLMDCQMPVMDGYTATRVRRQKEADQRLARIPIIAMTANAMAGDREKCLNAGMDDYMSKPLNRTRLEQTLRKWLHGRGPAATGAARVASAPAAPLARAAPPAPVGPVAPAALPLAGLKPLPAVTPLPAPAAGAALDTGIIGDLIDVMGDEFTDLVRVYLEDTPKAVARLEEAAALGQRDGIIAPSHSLKSTSANLGATRLSELAKRLEHGARNGDLAEPMALVAELKREYQQVAVALNDLIAKVRA